MEELRITNVTVGIFGLSCNGGTLFSQCTLIITSKKKSPVEVKICETPFSSFDSAASLSLSLFVTETITILLDQWDHHQRKKGFSFYQLSPTLDMCQDIGIPEKNARVLSLRGRTMSQRQDKPASEW